MLRKLTTNAGRDYDAVWSPTGDRMIFNSDRGGVLDLYERSLSGASASTDTLLLETPDHKNTCDWSADGRFLLYAVQSATTAVDLWALPLFGDRKPMLVAQTPANDLRGQFSPDGRSVAYESSESGRPEIYVQAFPEPVWKVQISTGGGDAPLWRADGRELFFRSPDGQLMAARISSDGRSLDSAASALFSMPPGPEPGRNQLAIRRIPRRQTVPRQCVCRGRLTHYGPVELEAEGLR